MKMENAITFLILLLQWTFLTSIMASVVICLKVIGWGLHVSLISVRFHFTALKARIISDQTIISGFNVCKHKMGIRKAIPLMMSSSISSPTLYGCIRPRLLLPSLQMEELNLNDLKYIFYHELSHFKRKDILMNWMMSLMLVIHWFNPLLWYAYYRMREDQEIASDAIALSWIGSEESKSYGYTIIKLIKHNYLNTTSYVLTQQPLAVSLVGTGKFSNMEVLEQEGYYETFKQIVNQAQGGNK